MPNRILKESIRESDSIDCLSWFEEVLFYRLIVSCDDYGRFDGRISVIKNRLFPLKENLTLKTVECAIQKLVSAGLVALYMFEGKPYLYLPSWTAHQNVRAKRSKYPEPGAACESVKASASICMQMKTEESSGEQKHANVPVIQSNTKSESVSESLSVSESKSESICGGGDAWAREEALAEIGLKPGEFWITNERVRKTVEATEELFWKYLPQRLPTAFDRRMVFLCSDQDGRTELLDYAMGQARMAGKLGDWRYVTGIIQNLRMRNITTVEQAREWDELRPDQQGEAPAATMNNLLKKIQAGKQGETG